VKIRQLRKVAAFFVSGPSSVRQKMSELDMTRRTMENINEEKTFVGGNQEAIVDPRQDLAIERTELALERTHLAWVRTVIGLITSGFVVDTGFSALHKARLSSGEAWTDNGHAAGLLLTVSGTLLMIMATFFYFKRVRELARMRSASKSFFAPDFILSFVIIGVGIILIYFMRI
jgi:uncharacterized membrane protein YidH (DUF202 family)